MLRPGDLYYHRDNLRSLPLKLQQVAAYSIVDRRLVYVLPHGSWNFACNAVPAVDCRRLYHSV